MAPIEPSVQSSTGASGVSTLSARVATLFAALTVTLSGFLDGSIAAEPLTALFAHAGTFMVALLVTDLRPAPLPFGRQFALLGFALITAALSLAAAPTENPQFWALKLTAYFLALNIARGNVLAGTIGILAITGLGSVWVVLVQGQPELLSTVLLNPILALAGGYTWHYVLRAFVLRERRHRTVQGRALIEAEAAELAGQKYQGDLMNIRAKSSATLSKLRDGTDLTPELLLQISILEATLRDRIRSPHLATSDLQVAVDRARQRGVNILLLGDPDKRTPLPPVVTGTVGALIAPLTTGEVTIRQQPPGRASVVSVLITQKSGIERIQVTQNGEILSRD